MSKKGVTIGTGRDPRAWKEIRDLRSQLLYVTWEKHNLVTANLELQERLGQMERLMAGYRKRKL